MKPSRSVNAVIVSTNVCNTSLEQTLKYWQSNLKSMAKHDLHTAGVTSKSLLFTQHLRQSDTHRDTTEK